MPAPLTHLFLDLNSFFASVEQQIRPELRGKPVAVVPMLTDSTCCIAASYEAKAFGVKTGTNVGEAKRMCPGLICVTGRHEHYIEFHHRIIAAVDTCLPVEKTHSIDEMSCRLMGAECTEARAMELARAIKRAIAQHVGEHLRCSIGIAPNCFLAKVGTDMQKPDGLVVIHTHELPERLFGLKLIDLPGIGRKMEKRLNEKGVHTVRELCACSELELVDLWESVLGRVWYKRLRGEEIEERPTTKRSIGHQHVLPPEQRTDEGARAVAMRLLHKAAARLRRHGCWAGRITLSVRHVGAGTAEAASAGVRWGGTASARTWSDWRRLPETRDTSLMVQALAELWAEWGMRGGAKGPPLCVCVVLDHLTHDQCAAPPLFEEDRKRGELHSAIDRLNVKYRRLMVHLGSMQGAEGSAPLRIAFSSIPDPAHDL